MEFDFTTDEDTKLLLEIAVWCLSEYFGHSEDEAVHLVNAFYDKFKDLWEDSFYHHEMPFRVAARMHYVIHLGGKNSEFSEWIIGTEWNQAPREAIEYFQQRFFDS